MAVDSFDNSDAEPMGCRMFTLSKGPPTSLATVIIRLPVD
jgi:hypothetical protein